MYSKLEKTIAQLEAVDIPLSRKQILKQLTDFIQSKKSSLAAVNLIFVCTHNSRRSHLSQVWAQALAAYYDIDAVYSYSGGTEATALFPAAAAALEEAGFEITRLSKTDNSVYAIKFDASAPPVVGFSKIYDHAFNPQQDFAAIMTCSSADQDCPFIPGASVRIPLTYEDPKISDGTDQQSQVYQERSLQIAAELNYVFAQIK